MNLNKTASDVFILEKAVAAGLTGMYRTTPILDQLAVTLNVADFFQTRRFLEATGPDKKEYWDRVRERLEEKAKLRKAIRDFIAKGIE